MKERPILMSGPLVREVLAGRKTKTRRPVKGGGEHGPMPCPHSPRGWARCADRSTMECTCQPVACPYDADRMWVRETWAPVDFMWRSELDTPCSIAYAADRTAVILDHEDRARPLDTYGWNWNTVKWRPGIHLRRRDARILLDVIDVRVERLWEITEEDARAEGVASVGAFVAKWLEIYGRDSWHANPWVWVISFRRIMP